MLKLLVLTSTFPRWENDTEPPFVFELCKQLSKEFEVHVLAPHFKGSLSNETIQNIRIRRFHYFFEPFENLCYQGGMLANLKEQPILFLLIPFFLFSQLLSAHSSIRQNNYSIIHAHWIIPQGLIAYLLKLVSRKPIKILCTSHGGDLYSLKGTFARFLKKKILLNINNVTVVNSSMKDEVLQLCAPLKPNVDIIPMGVDLKHFVPAYGKQRPFSLLFVGRLVEKKGLVYLINALPEVIQYFPEAKLTIIGTGPLKASLENLVQKQQLSNHVQFLGSIQNNVLPKYYQSHQIAVFPFIVADNGDREGMPVVVSEAIACGCRVITTDLPGLEDITEEKQGIFIIPQNNSKAISNTLLQLFQTPENIIQNSEAVTKTNFDNQSWDVIGQKYRTLINSVYLKNI